MFNLAWPCFDLILDDSKNNNTIIDYYNFIDSVHVVVSFFIYVQQYCLIRRERPINKKIFSIV